MLRAMMRGAPDAQHLVFLSGDERSPPPVADFCHSTRCQRGFPGPSAVRFLGPCRDFLASCELHSSPLASSCLTLTN